MTAAAAFVKGEPRPTGVGRRVVISGDSSRGTVPDCPATQFQIIPNLRNLPSPFGRHEHPP